MLGIELVYYQVWQYLCNRWVYVVRTTYVVYTYDDNRARVCKATLNPRNRGMLFDSGKTQRSRPPKSLSSHMVPGSPPALHAVE